MRAGVVVAAGAAGALVAGLSACAAPSPALAPPTEPSATVGELRISAAASLATAFDEMAAAFEAAHPGVDVLPIEFDGSSTLATQLIEGKPSDLFAAADEASLQRVADAGLIGTTAVPFATNTLVVVVPKGGRAGVASIAHLADPGLRLVLCDAEVPGGRAAARLLDRNGVSASPVSFEQNVTAVLTKVAAGEADAGLVYATDVAGRTDVESFVPDHAAEVVNRYPIAALDTARNPAAAAAFIAFVTGPDGRAILARHGFGAP